VNPRYNINLFVLQECGDFTWRVSDCEELVGHPIEHLGRNDTNYFMYQWAGHNTDRCLSRSIQLLHFNQTDRCLTRSLWVFIEQSEGL